MENEKVIAQIRVSKSGQKRITIPKENKLFREGDYVEVKKVK